MAILSSSSKQGADPVVPASYVYSKNGTVQHTVTTGYGADGRIVTAGFMHGGAEKQFIYGYLPGSNLLQTLTMPCNMTLTQSYESQRDLLIGMAYHRSTTLVAQRTYSYDTLGRPLTRSTVRNGQTVNDSFGYNTRSELTSAQVNGSTYGYDYDNIGNRNSATEGEEITAYEANNLNQYTAVGDFAPTFDADGNQTLVRTSTGIWSVQYNAENRPIRFTSADEATIIECTYDTHGRRATKKVTTNGSITLHQRYIYRGYLQIACCDLTRSGHPCLWLLTWDPTQPIATRPLAIRKDGTWYAYGCDLTKNICEVYGQHGYIRTAYTYSPYGLVTATGDTEQPIQWSSEYNDTELGLIYYNYRHYNPMEGRWLGRDIFAESINELYLYVKNCPILNNDVHGLFMLPLGKGFLIEPGSFELTVPLSPIFDIVGNITVEGADCFCKQKISISIGGSWNLKTLILRKLEKKSNFISRYIPTVSFSLFGEGEFEAVCGDIDFCTLYFGVAFTVGNGRRNSSKENGIWDYIGLSAEGKVGYNFCKKQIQGELQIFFSLSINTKYFSYNDMFELYRIGSFE